MINIYYLSTNNTNLFEEFLRYKRYFINRDQLLKLTKNQIKTVIMVAIDEPKIEDLFLPFKKKILYLLEYKEARRTLKLIFTYLYAGFFDLIFEWDTNLIKNSKSFLPFFPPRVGLIHESYKVKEVKKINYFYNRNFYKNKTHLISSVVSNKNRLKWHKLRLDLIFSLKSKIPEIDIFGRGFNVIPDKANSLIKYKYHIASENSYSGPSEKLWDPLLCNCIVFYAGNLNLIHPIIRSAIIPIDIYNFESCYKKIKHELQTSKIFNSLSISDWKNIKITIKNYYSFEEIVKKQIQNYI